MALRDLVDRSERWTDTDRRLIDTLLAHPKETAFLSTNELAKRASVHPASAVRFARKLGFDGYPTLRARLQMDLFGVSEAAERMRKRIEHVGKGSVLQSFVDSEIKTLSRLPAQIPDADILSAARALATAPHVFLFGVGHAGALTHLLDTRLSRLGFRTQVLKHIARDAAAALLQAGAADAFILFALNQVHPLVPKFIQHARAVGATSIVVTDLIGLGLRSNPNILLAASRGAEGEPRSLAVPMTVCNTLVLQVSRLKKRKTIHNLVTLDRIRKKLEAPS